MRTLRRQLLLLFCALAAGAAIFVALLRVRQPPDPVHDVRPLSEWLFRLVPSNRAGHGAASNAVTALGAATFPLVRACLQAEDGPAQRWLWARGIGLDSAGADALRVRGCHAVAVLGAGAESLLPLVWPLLTNSSGSVRLAALGAVASDGVPIPQSEVPILTNAAASDPLLMCRVHAANALLARGEPEAPVLQLLLSPYRNRPSSDKHLGALGWMVAQTAFSRDTLRAATAELAESADPNWRRMAAAILGQVDRLDEDLLRRLEADPNPRVRELARLSSQRLRERRER